MNDTEAYNYIKSYFYRLFVERDLSALEDYLDKSYWDDDIGKYDTDHVRNSKEYLEKWFKDEPTISVEVKKVVIEDDILTAYLEWYKNNGDEKEIMIKGIGLFTIKNKRIIRRHNYVYFKKK